MRDRMFFVSPPERAKRSLEQRRLKKLCMARKKKAVEEARAKEETEEGEEAEEKRKKESPENREANEVAAEMIRRATRNVEAIIRERVIEADRIAGEEEERRTAERAKNKAGPRIELTEG